MWFRVEVQEVAAGKWPTMGLSDVRLYHSDIARDRGYWKRWEEPRIAQVKRSLWGRSIAQRKRTRCD